MSTMYYGESQYISIRVTYPVVMSAAPIEVDTELSRLQGSQSLELRRRGHRMASVPCFSDFMVRMFLFFRDSQLLK